MVTNISARRAARAALNLAVSGFALGAAAAQAQDAATPATAASPEEIIVTGRRPIAESEAAALLVQKRSDSLVAVAAADSVGRLPDQNIAQAAGRLPGVAVERDQGQARYINLRGAPKTWTTLSIDGINVVSPEGRDTRYDSIPSAIASQIVVAKAVTPEMTGETISGNVNVVTRSGLDFPGLHVAGKLGYGHVELGSRSEYEAALVVSNSFDTEMGEFGVLISGSYYQRKMITDNFENDWEIPLFGANQAVSPTNPLIGPNLRQDVRPGFEDRYWVRETENKLYRLTRSNYSLTGRLDWKPSEDHRISLSSIYTIFKDDENRDNYIFDTDDRQADLVPSNAPCPAVTPVTTTGYADVCIGNTPFMGTIYGIDINQRSTLRAFRQSVFTNTLSGDHKFGDAWGLRWAANYTESEDDRSVIGEARYDSPGARTLRPTIMYDHRDSNLTRVRLFTTIQTGTVFSAGPQVTDIDSFTKPLSSFRSLDAVDTTKAYTGKFELRNESQLFGGNTTIRLGFQYDQRTKEAIENELLLTTAAQFAAAGLSTDYRNNAESGPFRGEIPLGYTFRYFDPEKLREAKRLGFSAPGAAYAFIPGNFYNVREQVYAAYLMGTARFDWGSIIGGARVEHVKNRGQAFATTTTGTGAAAVTTTARVEAKSDSTLVFPSLHVNVNLTDETKLRIGFTSGAARADYDQLRPNVVINDANLTISGGNPSVKPERAYGVDAYLENYFAPSGYAMIGGYYKRVEDVLFNSRRTFNSDSLNSGGVDRSGYAFSGIVNGGKGYVLGAEAAIQQQLDPYADDLGLPDWMGGFGLSANVTLNKSRVTKPPVVNFDGTILAERRLRLPGTSDAVLNIGGYYEKYGISLRLQYQLRTTWLDTVADTLVDAGDTYWAQDDELDFSARIGIRKGLELYFDASNLLNNPGRRYSDAFRRDQRRTIEWERFGRRYTGGVRFNF